MLEWIEALTLKQLAEYIAVTIGVISLIVEWNKKIPWHPWSSMFAWIGKQFTKGIDEKIERLNKQIQDTAKAVEDLHNEMEHRFDENEKNELINKIVSNFSSTSPSCFFNSFSPAYIAIHMAKKVLNKHGIKV